MSDASSPILFPSDEYLQALAGVAAMLPARPPRERDEALCCEFVWMVEQLLVRIGRGEGALDIAIASRLELIDAGDPLRLGFSSAVDYARERHGIPASTTQKWLRFSRGLRTRPLLRRAVWNGEVSVRKAQTIMRAAVGDDEAAWVARAREREQTVRLLHEAVQGEGRQAPADVDEPWDLFFAHVPAELRPGLDEAIELAKEQLGATASRWQCFRAMCQEVLGTFETPEVDDTADEKRRDDPNDGAEAALQAFLECESAKWSALVDSPPVTAPGSTLDRDADLRRIDEELCELMKIRRGWDELFGRIAFLFYTAGGWHRLGFASAAHHISERLGMQVRAVQQRIALERRLQRLPPLREALRTQRISYEKARLIAPHAHGGNVERWIERAAGMTCIDLKRLLERNEEAQMCARSEFRVWVPVHEAPLISAAFQAIQRAAGQPLTPGECIGFIAAHAAQVWKTHRGRRPNTVRNRVLARDRWLCQVPGCSKAAAHGHHIEPRSQGGSEDEKNRISLCVAHHLHGIHMGWVRVDVVGEDRLRWQLGVRPGFTPLMDVTVVAPWAAAASRTTGTACAP